MLNQEEKALIKKIPALNKTEEKKLTKQKQELFLKIFNGLEPNLLVNSKIKKFIEKFQTSNLKLVSNLIEDSQKTIRNNVSNFSFVIPKNCKAIYKRSNNGIAFAFEEESKFRTIIKSVNGVRKHVRVPFPKSLFVITLKKEGKYYKFVDAEMHVLKEPFTSNSKLYTPYIPHCLEGGKICVGREKEHLGNFNTPQEATDAFFKVFFAGVFYYNVYFIIENKVIDSYEDWSKLSLEDMKKVTRTVEKNAEQLNQNVYDYQLEHQIANTIKKNMNKAFSEMLTVPDLKKSFEEIFKSISKTVQ
jgi:ribosomal protein S17E